MNLRRLSSNAEMVVSPSGFESATYCLKVSFDHVP